MTQEEQMELAIQKVVGLQKDSNWLADVWNQRHIWANIESRRKGYPGAFQKGQHASPATEFKPKTKQLSI